VKNINIFVYYATIALSNQLEASKPAFLKMGLSIQPFQADFLRAFTHPIRIRILEMLGTRERSVQDLQQALGLEQPIAPSSLRSCEGRTS
jgi:hypothetical protein